MIPQARNVNMDVFLKPRRARRIEFWRNNGDGTCTRLADGLTLSMSAYNELLDENRSEGRQRRN